MLCVVIINIRKLVFGIFLVAETTSPKICTIFVSMDIGHKKTSYEMKRRRTTIFDGIKK